MCPQTLTTHLQDALTQELPKPLTPTLSAPAEKTRPHARESKVWSQAPHTSLLDPHSRRSLPVCCLPWGQEGLRGPDPCLGPLPCSPGPHSGHHQPRSAQVLRPRLYHPFPCHLLQLPPPPPPASPNPQGRREAYSPLDLD